MPYAQKECEEIVNKVCRFYKHACYNGNMYKGRKIYGA